MGVKIYTTGERALKCAFFVYLYLYLYVTATCYKHTCQIREKKVFRVAKFFQGQQQDAKEFLYELLGCFYDSTHHKDMISKIFGVTVKLQFCCTFCPSKSEEEEYQCICNKTCDTRFNFDHDTNINEYIGNISRPNLECDCNVGGSVKYSIVKPPSIMVTYSLN
jgi:hypothetical protein